jgi:phosphatidylglycerophosphatase A
VTSGVRGRLGRTEGVLATPVSFGIKFLATGAFIGYLPGAPGTFGTLAAIPLYLVLSRLSPPLFALSVLAAAAAAVPVAGRAEQQAGVVDPGAVVIDEMAGFLVAMFAVAPSWGTVAAGFILFRVFDILKPPPANWAQSLRGGLGIVADDIVAGIYANLALRLLWAGL